jgi:hypothetical protein
MANSHDYIIVDEPKQKYSEHLIVDPTAILFVSFFVPLFWLPPMGGRFWMPLVWTVLNGYFLGSPTLKKEAWISVAGLLGIVALFIGLGIYGGARTEPFTLEQIAPYIRLAINAILFTTLYITVFTQSNAYELFKYMKNDE